MKIISNILFILFCAVCLWFIGANAYYGYTHPDKTMVDVFLRTHKNIVLAD